MSEDQSKKRQYPVGVSGRRKHDKRKFRKITNPSVRKSDLTGGLSGILFSCTPRHEKHAYREAVLFLSKHCEETDENDDTVLRDGAEKVDANGKDGEGEKTNEKTVTTEEQTVLKSLDDELDSLRNEDNKLFTQVETSVTGAVFVRVGKPSIDLEIIVEKSLREARASGSPNARHCIRIIPIHTTCYAKPEEAAKAAAIVAKEHFPKLPDLQAGNDSGDHSEKASLSYAIAFRARLNSGVHRDEYIPAIADAVQSVDPRYKVNLTAPDVTLIVEILKTSCCIGTFRHFFQLAKMNLREAACPSAPKGEQKLDDGTAAKGGNCEKRGTPAETIKAKEESNISPPETNSQCPEKGTDSGITGAAVSKTEQTVSGLNISKEESSASPPSKDALVSARIAAGLVPQSGQSPTKTDSNPAVVEAEQTVKTEDEKVSKDG